MLIHVCACICIHKPYLLLTGLDIVYLVFKTLTYRNQSQVRANEVLCAPLLSLQYPNGLRTLIGEVSVSMLVLMVRRHLEPSYSCGV